MRKAKISGQMVVRNEDRFIWYAIASVLPYVDILFITDTGSTDNTIAIIETFRDKKIRFEKKPIFSPSDVTAVRQQQLERTSTDWIWIIDGDEVYPENTAGEILDIIGKKGSRLEGIVVGRYDLLGDIYHYQDDSAGYYDMWGRRGHFALRLINKGQIPGLHLNGIYPQEGYYDEGGREIINHPEEKFYFTKNSLFHAMYLKRSSLSSKLKYTFNRKKLKIEKGLPLLKEKAPQIFFENRPGEIEDITSSRSVKYELAAGLLTPLKKIKRSIF